MSASHEHGSPNANAPVPPQEYAQLNDGTRSDSPYLSGPETPQMNFPDSPPLGTPRSPTSTDPLFLQPFGSPAFPTNNRDSFMAPAPSFMSMGQNSRASYMSFGSEQGLAPRVGRSDSYASGIMGDSASESRPESSLGPSPLAAGAGLTAAAASAGAGQRWATDSPSGEVVSEKPRWMEDSKAASSKRRRWWLIALVALVALIGLGVGLGVGLHKKLSSKSGETVEVINGTTTTVESSPTSTSSSSPTATAITGVTGSLITLSNGTQMTYTNPHGGVWAYDATNPLLNSAQPNSWTPALNESWDWSDTIYGVNLGGWFVTEPFIVPGLYEQFPNGTAGTTIDEYTLSINMGDQMQTAMENHYQTFITEEDFMQIAAAGLNWIRLPIGFWALQTWDGEPFLEGVAWKYIVQAFGWARKYGLRINLDLHATPGSQNGWNHSGRLGSVNWMNGVMGLANLERSIDIMDTLLNFIMLPEWRDVCPMFGILNEPRAAVVSHTNLGAFYMHMHDRIRNVTGYGAGNGPVISVFEGFEGVSAWYGFAQGSGEGLDRAMLDVHQYTVFSMPQDASPASVLQNKGCSAWATSTNQTMNQFGLTNTGEWSLAWNDCGQWVNGVGLGARYDGTHADAKGVVVGSCEPWMRPETWNQTILDAMKNTYLAGVDSLQNNFFWTWKIGSTSTYANPAPAWSYKLGLSMGWIPNDPRTAKGYCEAQANITATTTFTGYQPFMTGGVGAGTVPASASSSYTWPLTSLMPSFNAAEMSSLPQYTRTASVIAAPAITTYSGLPSSVSAELVATVSVQAQAAFTAVAGCTYPDQYSAADLAAPTSGCGAGQVLTAVLAKKAQITPAPRRR